jgi:hypothetical protein
MAQGFETAQIGGFQGFETDQIGGFQKFGIGTSPYFMEIQPTKNGQFQKNEICSKNL